MEKQLKINSFKVRVTNYNNGISTKFDNRRVTVVKQEDSFLFEFRSIDNDFTPHALSICVRGKMAVTTIGITHEAAEVVMLNLAKMMGFKVVK